MKYKVMESGEWFEQEQGNSIACCHCGLVHDFNFKIRKGKLWLRVIVNNRSTGQVRRHMKSKVGETKLLHSVIKAQAELLTCYRLGRRPSEWALETLFKYRKKG